MPQITMVQHVNVQITDRQRTRQWYETVLGARFRERGPERNQRQLQLHLGNAEMHFTETDNPMIPARVHFAVEVDNWGDMLAHLDALGIALLPCRARRPWCAAGQGTSSAGAPATTPVSTTPTSTIPTATSSSWYTIPWGWSMPTATKSKWRLTPAGCAGVNCQRSKRPWGQAPLRKSDRHHSVDGVPGGISSLTACRAWAREW